MYINSLINGYLAMCFPEREEPTKIRSSDRKDKEHSLKCLSRMLTNTSSKRANFATFSLRHSNNTRKTE